MIKILHILATLDKGSGVANVVMNYYKSIDKEKVQFDFLYFVKSDNNYISKIVQSGGRAFYMEKPSILKYLQFKKYINDFFQLHTDEYKAVHLHEVYLNVFLFPIAKKNGINNCIAHVHTTKYSDKKISALRNHILCLPLKQQATTLMACSKAAGAFYYSTRSVKERKVKILNNAILCDVFQFNPGIRKKYREKLKCDNKLVVGHVGRFNEQKNHLFLISIFTELLKKIPNSLLILIGDGPLKNMITEKVIQTGIQNQVLFLGKREDVSALLQAIDVFILPSLFEGLPVVGIEAQASGLPCIFTDTITKEVEISNTKYLSLKEKPEKWAEKISEMAANSSEEERANGVEKIKMAGYDIKEQSKLLECFYQNLD